MDGDKDIVWRKLNGTYFSNYTTANHSFVGDGVSQAFSLPLTTENAFKYYTLHVNVDNEFVHANEYMLFDGAENVTVLFSETPANSAAITMEIKHKKG